MFAKIVSYIPIVMAIIFAFFGYAIKISGPIQGIGSMCLAVLCLFLMKKKIIKISKDDKLWLIYTLLIFLSLLFSINVYSSISYIIMFMGLVGFKIIIDNFELSIDKVEKIIISIGIIHVIATLLYLLVPNVIQVIASKILSVPSYIYIINLFKRFFCF